LNRKVLNCQDEDDDGCEIGVQKEIQEVEKFNSNGFFNFEIMTFRAILFK
jgi:hypothetical protein